MNIIVNDLITKCQRNIPDIGQRVEPTDWYYYFTEAIRSARAGRTLPWQRVNTQMEFFTDIFEYALPSDFDSFIKPHKDMLVSSDYGPFLLYGRDKDFFANGKYGLGIKWDREIKTLLARKDSIKSVLMDGFSEDVSEYDGLGDASNLVSDTIKFKQGAASLRFDITASEGQVRFPRLLDSSIDLTDYLNKGYAFLWVYMPTVIDSVTIRYGNDDSNYYEIADVVTDFNSQAFKIGWNLIKFDMESVTETGSPSIDTIDYYNILLNHTGVTDTDFRIDAFTFHIPSTLELPYNSKYVVRDSGGVYKESVTFGTDIILCDETFESAFMYDAIENAANFKLRDADLIVIAKSKKDEKYRELNRRYPSVEAPVQSNYYKNFNSI